MKAILHNHTMHSIKDSCVSISELVKKAKELNAPAVALTDHGVMTGVYEFYKLCKKEGIKPIIGCEYYVKNHSFGDRLHLIVMARDYIGYQALIKLVKLSNKNIAKVGTLVFPECTDSMLEECFGKNSDGYGHVIATSACVGGVVCGLNYQNENLQEVYASNIAKIEKNDFAKEQIKKLEAMIKSYEAVVSAKASDEAVSEAKERVKNIKKSITTAKKDLLEESVYNSLLSSNKELSILYKSSKEELLKFMEEEALRYENLFGKGNFFLELQYHGLPEEKEFMYQLDLIAEKNQIPTCAANDAHMLDNSEDSVLARQTLTGLRWNMIQDITDADRELYLKTEEELYTAISSVVGTKRADVAMAGIDTIAEQCNVEFCTDEKHYPVFNKNADSFKLLVDEVKKGISVRFPDKEVPKEYKDRINYELGIIRQMNVSDYLLIVQDLLRFGRKLGNMPVDRYKYLEENIWNMSYEEIVSYVDADQSYFGYTVGPGRGSSAGSLVCYIIGITDLDPIPYGLLFERFLNPERVSMPDIDSDYGNGYRDIVIAYTYKKYGEDAVCRIITFGTNASKAAIKNVARAIGKTKSMHNENSDVIIRHYQDLGDRLSKICSGKPHDTLSNYDDTWKTLDEESKEIIRRAKLIEGTFSQHSLHACGVIVSDNKNVNEYIPLSWDDKNLCWKSQLVYTEAEDLGLLKIDFLGLKNMNMITDMIRLVEKNHGVRINPATIPVESDTIKAICSKGQTNSIFQLESAGMKDICKKMNPDSFEDLILLVAAYRPGPMESIPDIIRVKTGVAPATYLIPELEHILNVTYAKPIYQEQVQQIFRDLAGYSYGQADEVRRAMAKKKEHILLNEREAFINGDLERGIEGCVARGIDADKANQLFDEMISFASYAFNKSHAAVYARIAYIMMYLKVHYFLEFMTVALEWASEKQVMGLISECKEQGVKILPPDINKSEEGFTISDGNILFGLSSVKGIVSVDGILKARAEKKYENFKDFVRRGHFKKNVTEALIWSGAFGSISTGRKAISLTMEQLIENCDAIQKKMAQIEETRNIIRILELHSGDNNVLSLLHDAGYKGKTIPKIDRKKKDLANYEMDLQSLQEINEVIEEPISFKDDIEFNIKKEKELLGVYLTGHPVDSYFPSSKCTKIEVLQPCKSARIFGAITNLRIKQRKSDGKAIAFFVLEDRTGSVEVSCFSKAFEKYGHLLKEGNILELVGSVDEEVAFGSEDNEEAEKVLKFSIYEATEATKKLKTLMISLNLITDWDNVQSAIMPYIDNSANACKLVVWDKAENKIRETTLKVNEKLLFDSSLTVREFN